MCRGDPVEEDPGTARASVPIEVSNLRSTVAGAQAPRREVLNRRAALHRPVGSYDKARTMPANRSAQKESR
jgi:hypothetical protein